MKRNFPQDLGKCPACCLKREVGTGIRGMIGDEEGRVFRNWKNKILSEMEGEAFEGQEGAQVFLWDEGMGALV